MMTNLKTLSAVIFLSAAFATPAFAHATKHSHADNLRHFRGVYNQLGPPSYFIPQTQEDLNVRNFGFSGGDPSRVGGEDPSLHPSGS
jgi:hypothetical protein